MDGLSRGATIFGRDTFKTYNPVTLAVGCLFVVCGLWIVFAILYYGTRTLVGGLVVFVLGALIPLSLGAVIIRDQLRSRKNQN